MTWLQQAKDRLHMCRAARLSYSVAHGGQIVAPFSIAQAFVSYCVPERPQMKEESLLRNPSERRGQLEAADPSKALVAAVMRPDDGYEGMPGSPHLTRMSKGSYGLHGRQAEEAGIELSKTVPARASEGARLLCLDPLWSCAVLAMGHAFAGTARVPMPGAPLQMLLVCCLHLLPALACSVAC